MQNVLRCCGPFESLPFTNNLQVEDRMANPIESSRRLSRRRFLTTTTPFAVSLAAAVNASKAAEATRPQFLVLENQIARPGGLRLLAVAQVN